jgi:Fe-Mn family superoxide dismutase
MIHQLPALKFDLDALAPVISKQTLEFHYGKHHQAYVNNLNNLIKETKFENSTLETIVKEADGGIFNNAAQIWNHTFYFEAFSKNGGGEPSGKIAALIADNFGSFADFKEKFAKAAVTQFGSGWAWLVVKADGKLDIIQTSNAACPIKDGLKPLLTCDVWEHAYYLDYQNRRPDYVEAFWKIVDWKVVENRL